MKFNGIGRREFGKLAAGALGAAAFARDAAAVVQKVAPGIKLCVQSPPTAVGRAACVLEATWRAVCERWVDTGPSNGRGLRADQKALCRRRHPGLEHRQYKCSQHAGGDAEPARSRREDRGIQTVSAQSWQSRHLLHHLCAYGQRHLDERKNDRARSFSARVRPEQSRSERQLGREKCSPGRSPTDASTPRKRSGKTTPTSSSRLCRSPKKRAFASGFTRMIRRCRCWPVCRAASSATSRATSGRWRSPTVRMSASVCAVVHGSKAARS